LSDITTPHDHFFKRLISQREAAQDFVRYYLPQELVRLMDLSTLELCKDSFVDAELRSHFSDLLYNVRWQGGGEAHVYVLFEHKSAPDRWVAFQLLRYLVRIWEQDLQQRQRLFPVVPVVVYHGVAQWQVALDLWSLFGAPEEVRPYMPDYRYWLCDLSAYSDEEIQGEVLLRMGLLTLKYILRDDLREHLRDILGLGAELVRRETGLEYLETLLRYLAQGTEKVGEEDLRAAVEETIPKGGKLMATIAEKWVEQGLQQGLEQGLQVGALRQLLRVLEHRFGEVPPETEEKLRSLDASRLEALLDVALDVGSLTEFGQHVPGLGHER